MRRRRDSEDGYTLLAVIFLLFLFSLALTVAIPDMARSIQRDREIETMHRGKQYIRAIQLYYRKFHAYPPSIDALVNTNNIRFLRKRYIDPLTGKDDWKPIYFGQNKAPLAMGFFGQPLGGLNGAMPVAGIGPGGSGGMGNAGLGGQNGAGFGGQTGGTFGSTGGAFGSTGGSFGSSFGGGMGSSQGGSSVFGSDNSNNSSGANAPDNSAGTPGNGTDNSCNAGNGNGNGTGTAGMGTGITGGQMMGGGGIIGVEPVSPKQSLLVYKKKDHYNQWEFTYTPLMDMMQQAGAGGMMGTPNTGLNGSQGMPGSSGTGTGTFGGSTGSFGGGGGNTFGGSGGGGFGSSPSPSPSPTPQQPQ